MTQAQGKQVNFFLENEDWDKIINYLSKLNLLLIGKYSQTEKPLILSDFLSNKSGELIKYLVLESQFSEVKTIYLENKKIFYVDQSNSPVIELHTCVLNEEAIFRGRFFYNPTFFNPKTDSFEKKNEVFLKTAQNLMSWFKKNHLPLETKGFYSSATAQKKKFIW